MRAIHQRYRDTFEDFVRDKCEVGRGHQTHWSDLHHALGRLLSYFFDVTVLATACRCWPELFVDFTVIPVASSIPDSRPPEIRKSAARIMPRITSDEEIINTFRRHEARFQDWGLDEKIKHFTEPERFKPFVHSETLIASAIQRRMRVNESQGLEPLRFFREDQFGRYVGCSKPTCRLCALYFAALPGGIRVRPSHYNLYINWRAPDIFVSDGRRVEAQRDAVLQHVAGMIRDETFTAIRKQSATHRPFDSNDTASNVPPPYSTDRSSSIITTDNDPASSMGGLHLQTIQEASLESSQTEVAA